MATKVKYEIEEVDNGAIIRIIDDSDGTPMSSNVCVTDDGGSPKMDKNMDRIFIELGKSLYDELDDLMNTFFVTKVEMCVEFKPIKDK